MQQFLYYILDVQSWTLHNWFVFGIALYALSLIGVGIYYDYAMRKGILDLPNPRSSHKVVTPRGGGIVFVVLWYLLLTATFYFLKCSPQLLWILAPGLALGILGHMDDRKSMKSGVRFFIHALCAIVSLTAMGATTSYLIPLEFIPLWAVFIALAFGIVWLTNLYNFMDGMDGIAATQAVFVFGVGGYFLFDVGAVPLVLLCWGLVGLVAGFLTWNWPTAKIFMGDAGSGFLGFLIAIFALMSYIWFDIPLLLWAMISGVFWFDATVTLIRRIIARENWLEAHNSHAYQRMLQCHWSHTKVLLFVILINVATSGLAIWSYQNREMLNMAFGLCLALLIVAYLLVEFAKPMFKTWHKTTKLE